MGRAEQEEDRQMNVLCFRLTVVIFCASAIILGGCASTAPSRFYVLNPIPSSGTGEQVKANEPCVSLGVGPIELPEYLDRPQVVTRLSQNEIHLAEFDQWAEPLHHNFSRVLAENLSILLCVDNVAIFPWKRDIPIDYQVSVEVTRFDGLQGGDVLLKARWTLLGQNGRKVLLKRQSSFREPVSARDYESLVSAQSRVLEQFSREIADAISGSHLKY